MTASRITIAALLAAMPMQLAHAQQAAESIADPGEIVVTAQQREERLIDVPITINTIDGAELKQRRITTLQELSFAVPELINVVTGMAQNRAMLRGVGDGGGNFPQVGIYLDNIAADGPLGRPLDLRVLDVERIEVLNGPQGTLYGQGSLGGTVRFLTRAPIIGETSLSADAELWSTKGGAASQRVTGVANIAVSDQIALRVSGIYENLGGWIDAPTARRRTINDGELFEIRVKALVQLTDSLTLTPMVQIHRNDVGSLSNGENADGNLILPAFAPGAVQPASNDHELYSLTADWDLGGVNLLAVGSAFRNVSRGAFYSPFAGNGRFLRFDNDDKAQSVELRLSSDSDRRWRWAVGGLYRHGDYYSNNTLYLLGPANGTIGTPVNFPNIARIRSDSLSVYANTGFDLTDRLEIGGGLRYFSDKEQSPSANQADQTFDSVDPRVYVSYRLDERWNIFASVAKGFRSGGFNVVNPAIPSAFGPEKLWSYEVGTKFATADGLLTGEVAGFISRYSDMQVSTIANSIGVGFTGNVGRAQIKGIDWSLELRPLPWLALGSAGALLDTEVVSVAPRSAYARGDRLNYIPKSNLTFFVEAHADLSASVEGRLRVDYNRRGAGNFAQRTANLTAQGDRLDLMNGSITFDFGRYTLGVFSDNLLNERDQIFPNPVAFATRVPPRTIGIRGSASF
ncbi:TonB-dependent receptor [Rhizorhabdus sp. FW153]|uniref:TonB-dependent receptor n=1 Tax=Rhizorhabdus sp. FW153 TaxID=3400216 RepID=UPI003CF0ABFA